MTARRVTLAMAVILVVVFSVPLGLRQWHHSSGTAAVVATIAAIVTVAIALWATLLALDTPTPLAGSAQNTGSRGEMASNGLNGRAAGLEAPAEGEEIGRADAAGDGDVNR